MADGYGFAGEGDWKTAALVRAMKVMASGLKGGTSFMEDYTYHLQPGNKLVLGAHMLEICPSIAAGKPSLAGASAGHRRQGGSGAAGVQHARRHGTECGADGFRQPLPVAHQRSGCASKPEHANAQIAGRPGACGNAVRISRTRVPHGFTPAARITPASARPSPRKCSKTSRPSPELKWSSLTRTPKLRQFKQELVWNDCAYGLKSGWVS